MTSNDLATDVHNYLANEDTGTVSMLEILAALGDHPELAGMNTARAARKLRRVLAGLDDIVKLGAKRGAAYVYDPDAATERSRAYRIEEKILLHHLYGGGRSTPESLYGVLTEEFPDADAAINEGLDNLLQAGALVFRPPETVLGSEFWFYSGLLPRGNTSFTHTGTAGHSMEKLTELLTLYARDQRPLPGTSIPAPTVPSRSMAIEAAVVFTVVSLKRDLQELNSSES
ncbi:uncharacterized protein METZ01_LOCUS301913 [marine metagenome]|uniref:Uncharacterized protein n=1 Tax=marine metagenome TaxID=408172 RepID=A0A382MJP0_9ZZZZ